MYWTLFLYTARTSPFKANDRKYLLVFVDADFNDALNLFEKEMGFHPLINGYEVSVGKSQEEAWENGLSKYLDKTNLPFNKIINLVQTLCIKKDSRCKDGYRITIGSK